LQDGTKLLVTTSRGLFVLANDRATQIGANEGLPPRAYFTMLRGDKDTYWLCSNHGIVSLVSEQLNSLVKGDTVRLTPKFFDRADGMTTTQCNGGTQPSGWHARDGRIFFATARGVAVFDPKREVRVNQRPPPVHIVSAAVDSERLSQESLAKLIALPSSSRRIEFKFVGLSFVDVERVRYRYRMEGFDKEWVEAGRDQSATYTNLPPGEYRFHVIAANNDGVWNEAGASVSILKRAAFYESNAFRATAALLLVVAVALFLWVRTRALARQSRQLQRLVDQRTHDLSAQKDALVAANEEKIGLLQKLQVQSEDFERLAKEDALTGLVNRRELDHALASEWQRAGRTGAPLSAIVADIDTFKSVNDRFSHAVGDAVLRQVAILLRQGLRSLDTVARYGGEEFVMLLPETNLAAAQLLAERLRLAVEQYEWQLIHPELTVTMSFGVATDSEIARGAAPERLIMLADGKLYRAKEAGRNRVVA
jgi:diguanylate cyclase (GGDEF)-like protein